MSTETDNIKRIGKRFRYVYLAVFGLGLTALVWMLRLQFFTEGAATFDDFYRTEIIPPVRGNILAHDGRHLALSMPFYRIRMDCTSASDSVFRSDIRALSRELAALYRDKSAAVYEKNLTRARREGKKYYLINTRDLNFLELEQLRKFPIFRLGQFKGGLIVEQRNRRTNPYGRLAYRTIGYMTESGIGVGIEGSYDQWLKGSPGERTIAREVGGKWIQVNGETYRPAVDGLDIRTTLDIDIQEAAETALRRQLALSDKLEGGTAVVMDVRTGAVRAIANMKKLADGRFDESYNYAIREANDPGSTFKLVTLVSLIEDGYVTLDTPVDAGDGRWKYYTKVFTDTHIGGYGKLNVLSAFEKSSNIAFAKLATTYYVGRESEFIARIHSMKVGEKMNLDIEGEATARIPAPGDASWSGLSLPMISMGYELAITPLQTLTFYNAIANDGKMMRPYFVESFERDGKTEKRFPPKQILGSVCSKSTLKEVRKALEGVVEKGTARAIRDERYRIAGKTGTAQILHEGVYTDRQGFKKHQASFAGYFPADNPRYSCIVVLYSAKTRGNFYGASWAAPVFKEIADHIYNTHPEWNPVLDTDGHCSEDLPDIAAGQGREILTALRGIPVGRPPVVPEKGWVRFRPDSSGLKADRLEWNSGTVPDVSDMGLTDALYLLENCGYTVSFEGKGRVRKQQPAPGSPLGRRGQIHLILNE